MKLLIVEQGVTFEIGLEIVHWPEDHIWSPDRKYGAPDKKKNTETEEEREKGKRQKLHLAFLNMWGMRCHRNI